VAVKDEGGDGAACAEVADRAHPRSPCRTTKSPVLDGHETTYSVAAGVGWFLPAPAAVRRAHVFILRDNYSAIAATGIQIIQWLVLLRYQP